MTVLLASKPLSARLEAVEILLRSLRMGAAQVALPRAALYTLYLHIYGLALPRPADGCLLPHRRWAFDLTLKRSCTRG